MADSRDDPEFFLPSHFLTDDVVLANMDDDNNSNNFRKNSADSPASGFPNEFPYEFDSSDSNSPLRSPVESVVGSTETETSDEDDFFAGLTRRLAQSSLQPAHQTRKLSVPTFAVDKPEWVVSGSPQSTLSGIGSWSSNASPTGPSPQVPSPPTSPFGAQNDTWDLIYAAAGQVARLKMTTGGEGPAKFNNNHTRGLLGPPRRPSPPQHHPCMKNAAPGLCSNQSFNQFPQVRLDQVLNQAQCSAAWGRQSNLPWSAQPHQQPQHHQQQIQNRGRNVVGYENGRCGHGLSFRQSAWPPLQVQQHQNQHPQPPNSASMRPILPIASNNVKRESAGTGVFLPRRYSNPAPPEPRKKAGCQTSVLLPAKVVQALNLNFEEMNHHTPPRFNGRLAGDHEGVVARRNALLSQPIRGLRSDAGAGPLNYEVRLPQEWTY